MRRLTAFCAVVAAVVFLISCSGSSSPAAPTSPTTSNATPTTTTVTVSGTGLSVDVSGQFSATAISSNGSSTNVTSNATWQSSNTSIATVTPSGLVSGIAAGEVDIRAIYQGVTGSAHVVVARAVTFTISGAVTDGTSGGVLPNITVRVLDGNNAGKAATTDGSGRYSIAGLSGGTLTLSASATGYQSTTKTVTVAVDTRVDFVLPRVQTAPPPPPTPTPPPPNPSPAPSTGFYVWGGPSYTQYLGFFTCVFCSEFGSDSINNQFGIYGSPFSATSIRNQFSQYGNPFSTYSACGQFAGSPPRVFNSNRSIYYGELTLNQFRLEAIKTSAIVSWLTNDVCRH